MGYTTIDEAVEKINYFLQHDEERKKIAAAGFEKTKSCYLFRHTFYDIVKHLEQGIKEKQSGIILEKRQTVSA